MVMCEINSLPLEIRSYIFGFLDVGDRRELALVSKAWYSASLDPALYKNTSLVLDATQLELRDKIQFFHCKCPNVKLVGVDADLIKRGMSIFGPHVEKLHIERSNLTEDSLINILRKCKSLMSLSLCGCKRLFDVQDFLKNATNLKIVKNVLRSCKEMDLSRIQSLTDAHITLLINSCPNLQSLRLASNNIANGNSSSRNSLSSNSLLRNLHNRRLSLTKLDLSRTSITSKTIQSIGEITGLKLKQMFLSNCDLDDSDVSILCKHQIGIRVLHLDRCQELTNGAISYISKLKFLESLSIQNCIGVTDGGISQLINCQKLQTLNVSGCYSVSIFSLHPLIVHLPNFSVLYARACSMEMKKEALKKIIAVSLNGSQSITKVQDPPRNATLNLSHLDVGSPRNLNGKMIQTIWDEFSNLEYLDLSWASHLEDGMLPGLFKTEKDSYTEQEVCDNITVFGIGRLKKLKALNLSNCGKLTTKSFRHLFRKTRFFPQLHCLQLDMLSNAVDDAIISGIVRTCPLLTNLSIANCTQVTDDGIKSIAQLRRLANLNISVCDGITERCLPFLKSLTQRWLTNLDLSCCKNISHKSTDQLRQEWALGTKIHSRYVGDANLLTTL